MKAQYIVDNTQKANELLQKGWHLDDHVLAVASGGMSGTGLTSYGIEYVANKVRVEARTFVLSLENAEPCRKLYTSSVCTDTHCTRCCGTKWVKKDE